jgi:hypothetical protein
VVSGQWSVVSGQWPVASGQYRLRQSSVETFRKETYQGMPSGVPIDLR